MSNSNSILSKLEKIKGLLDGLIDHSLSSEIEDLNEKLSSARFYLVILGLFKRGKSSFINALLQDNVVPSGVVPLTAIITLIEYAGENKAEIYFEDNHKEITSLSNVKEFIAEEKNPHNQKGVYKVVIYHSNELLKHVTIIDTPGVGSSLEHNTETTLQFVNKIDAALFILSTDIPITQLEVDFLKTLKQTVPKVIFILNKIDLLDSQELNELLNYNKKVLNKICDQDIKLYLTSSRLALNGYAQKDQALIDKSNIEKVKEEIFVTLADQKDDILKQTTLLRVKNILAESESLLNFKLKTLQMPSELLDEKLNQFRKSLIIMRENKDEFDILMDGKIKQLQEYVAEQADQLGDKIVVKLKKDIKENENEILEELRQANLNDFQNKYFESIKNEFDKLKTNLENEVIDRFKKLLQKYGEGSNEFMKELMNSLTDLMNMNFDTLANIFDLNIYTTFYYNFNAEPIPLGLNNKLIRHKMPKAVLRKTILEKLVNNFVEKVNSNAGKIKYDINYRIQESFIQFKFDLNQKLDSILKNLESILNKTLQDKKKQQYEIEDEVSQLKSRLIKLKEIQKNIQT